MVIETLAPRFPQLYVAPSADAEPLYKLAALRGIAPAARSLSHFEGTDEDWLKRYDTPAGSPEVLFLKKRSDFETFLRCIGHRARPDKIPATIGATTYTNLADWEKIRQGIASGVASGLTEAEAFKATVSDPESYRISLIVVSEGPNSAVPFARTPFGPDEWLCISREIRIFHELAHYVCRRLMPDDTPPVLDEVTADFNGIVHALGHYDASLAALLLGVDREGYCGGRLQEYLSDEQKQNIDAIARDIFRLISLLAQDYAHLEAKDSFDAVLAIKRTHPIDY